MTKKELYESIVALNNKHDLPEAYVAALDTLVKPGTGGGKDVSDYTVFNEDGEPEFIYCNLHKKWEPVTDVDGEELFKVDPKSKNGYQRDCLEGIVSFKEINKQIKASEKSIMDDLLNGEIEPEDAKAALAEVGDVRSQIPARADELGEEERPEAA